MSESEAYLLKMDAMLAEWPHRIEMMAERTPTIVTAKRPVYEGLIKLMREKYQDCLRRLSEYRAAAASALPESRLNLERAWSDLANAYEKALCQFEGVKN